MGDESTMMLAIDLIGRLVLVVGGGEVAGRKVESLLDAGARVQVISPAIGQTIQRHQAKKNNQVTHRPFHPGDTAGAWLVVAATGNPEVDRSVAKEVQEHGGLVCVSGWPELGNVRFPAEVRRGSITVGITTDGASPALARHLRQNLVEWIGPEYGRLAEMLAELRTRFKSENSLSQKERARLFTALVDGPLLGLLKQGNENEAQQLIAQMLESHLVPHPGSDS